MSLNGTATITLDNSLQPPAIVNDRSLVITKQAGYSSVKPLFTLGRMLKDNGNFINYHICQDRPGDPLKDLEKFVRNPFQAGANDVNEHNAWTRVKFGAIPTIRNTFQEKILNPWTAGDENGPFRLLAVVNRMDIAGDIDSRGGGNFAGSERRWFGEGRLVFGLNQDVDGSTPYPMTLIMEYRLPALKETTVGSNTTYELDTSFDNVAGPAGNDAWRDGRARWAKLWRELSRYPHTDARYKALLLNIVKLFATGDNLLALRTGERVYDTSTSSFANEFEYREFYHNDQWNLATRKLRREPILCAQGSNSLKNRILEEWNPAANDFHFTFMLGERKLEQTEVDELSALCGNNQYPSPKGLPYGQDLNSGGYGLRAKFTRFNSSTLWTISNVNETRRHKTAAATCSGCHSTETGNSTVFHISPRLAGEDAQVSAFLTGPVQVNPNGTPYTLNELADRSTMLANFAARYDYSLDYPASHEQLYCNINPCSQTTYP
ncbi:hypothetical protein JY651_22460 [Pyxidicoccus parkwayensis]|uniref:Lipoprotein n=1 Tax=Pyxidicoccus parkwayensis TaxID=2813578 RepID=A0ABX7PAK4_9BACT|nr:hypothetical protein [Pyxidicoccus parkwaysis]QSQ27505.1 hypothetical protein JY651_22460 [Pyxidicoccus parkwaysis]